MYAYHIVGDRNPTIIGLTTTHGRKCGHVLHVLEQLLAVGLRLRVSLIKVLTYHE